MTTRSPYQRREPAPLRDENTPVGAVNSTGFGATKLGDHITNLVRDESALMVVMASNGEVFAIDPSGLRAEAISTAHPEWICGTYTARCGAGTIAGDLRVQAKQVGRVAA